ncbi:hypothetical protein BT96DRAFT_941796 [Gymnopus androsaceus JB14]|uniref:Uncharacterized protein n=1 Tax=Gymnopus androsaceus JB14 TaxID=1447944 RepID=A0A6A4HEJ9_9AGAR|nr:hypothetical protein BT96DRAFT_941796 [Gymnopus androsaceus JB14]
MMLGVLNPLLLLYPGSAAQRVMDWPQLHYSRSLGKLVFSIPVLGQSFSVRCGCAFEDMTAQPSSDIKWHLANYSRLNGEFVGLTQIVESFERKLLHIFHSKCYRFHGDDYDPRKIIMDMCRWALSQKFTIHCLMNNELSVSAYSSSILWENKRETKGTI